VDQAVAAVVRRTGRPLDDWDVSPDGELLVWQDGQHYSAGLVAEFADDEVYETSEHVEVNFAATAYSPGAEEGYFDGGGHYGADGDACGGYGAYDG